MLSLSEAEDGTNGRFARETDQSVETKADFESLVGLCTLLVTCRSNRTSDNVSSSLEFGPQFTST